MTTTTPEGAPDTGGALDPFHELWKLLPKLVQPSWHRHVHSGMYHENRHKHTEPDSPAVQKAKRREQRKHSRFARALAGEHTRVPRAA